MGFSIDLRDHTFFLCLVVASCSSVGMAAEVFIRFGRIWGPFLSFLAGLLFSAEGEQLNQMPKIMETLLQ